MTARTDDVSQAAVDDSSFMLPASHAQARLWFLSQLGSRTGTYNLCFGLRMKGALDVAVFQRALSELVRRHESLRTRFEHQDEGIMQVVYPAAELPLERVDLSGFEELARTGALDRECEARISRAFDLEHDHLLRVTLFDLSRSEHFALLVVHHIVFDGWSMGVFSRELAELYRSFHAGQEPALEELELQYADYSDWHRQWLEEPAQRQQIDYWKKKLAGSLPVLQLPADRGRPAARTFQGVTAAYSLPGSLLSGLKARAQQEGATLFMLLLTAFDVLVHRYSGTEDVIVGTPIANRSRAELEGIIGFFANTLALRTPVHGDDSLREVLRAVRATTLEAYDHQDVPFDQIVEHLRLPRELSTSPVFQAMLVLHNQPTPELRLPELTVTPVEVDRRVATFDLVMSLEEGPRGLACSVEYSTELFERATIDRLVSHWTKVLEALVREPDTRVAEVDLLSEEERRHLLSLSMPPRTAFPVERCAHEWVALTAKAHPGAVAARHLGAELTYSELEAGAERLARRLVRAGVLRGMPVPLCIERSLDMLVGMLGILKAGGAILPVDLGYPADRITYMVTQSRSPVVISARRHEAALPADAVGSLRRVWMDDLEGEAPSEAVTLPRVDPLDLVYVLYTSGSTGLPKGVAMSHRAHSNLLEWERQHSMSTLGTRTLQFASPSFDVSLQEIFSTWATGGLLVLPTEDERRDGEALLRLLSRERVERLFLPVVGLSNLAAAAVHSPEVELFIREIAVAGEQLRLTQDVRAMLRRLPRCQLLNHYGPTETHAVSWWGQSEPIDQTPTLPPIGRPLPNFQVYLLDARLRLVPAGVAGELYAAGEGLARGYLSRPELTAERFLPDPFGPAGSRMYRTGDLARLMPDGHLEYLGRADHQVKIRGFRVELGEIESILGGHERVRENVVVVREDASEGGKRLVAYVAVRSGAADAADLRSFLRERLPEFMVPAAFVFLPALPLSSNKKVDRRALPEPGAELAGGEGHVPPGTETERKLAAIWSQLLGVSRIGADSNFFDLGGHSLLATREVSRLREAFGVNVSLKTLFELPTLGELALGIDQLRRSTAAPGPDELVPVDRGGPLLASFAQQRLWFLDQLESHSAFYNMHVSVRLEGRVDLAALEDSVEALAERHEVLRTRLVPGANGELLQEIAPDARRIRLDVVSLLSLAPEAREARAREVARGWIEAPFDLRRGPLLRAHLCELSETESLLFVVMHHAVSDGGSLSILTGELAELYEARVAGRTPELAPLPLQYADYAAWQRRSAEHGKLETQLTYWKKQLAGELPVLELPRDGARPPVQRYRGTTLSRTLPLSLRERLRSFSTAAGVTPFMTLMAAYQVLLHRLSGQDEVLVGTPISGRASRSTEGLIGCFLNTLVIRTRLRPDEGFRAVLDRVRDTCLEAYAHQDVPFEKLVEALQPVRSTQHTPLFQTMLVHHTHSGAPASFGALRTSPFELEGETSTFDLTVTLIESGQDFLLRAELDTDLFEPEVVTTWLEGFEVLLNSALAHPDRALTALAWVPEAWRARMLRTWNTTAAPHEDVCVHALIEDQAARRPDAVAVRFGDGALSYGELNRRANQLAHGLRRQGVGPDSVVAVVMERGLELFVGMLGVLKAGGAYLPIDPVFPRERMGMMLEDSRTPLLLTQAHVVPRLPAHGAQVVVLGEGGELLGNEREDNPDSGVRPSHLAYVIYTSGSTGRPKGAMVEHRALVNYAHVTREDYGFTASDRVLQFSSISWDVSTVEEIFPALTCGATLVVRTPEMLDAHTHFWAKLRDERITTINLPTAFWHEVVANLGPSFVPPPSLRLMVTGGERALPERALAWARHMPASVRLVNTYGVSEAASVSVLGDLFTPVPVDGRPLREVSLGRVIRNSGIYILDARLEPVPVGAPGELFIAGLGLGRGYLNQPELTATRFVPDPFSGVPGARLYRTGDVARYLPDGSVQYVRRADTQVKIRGYRVEPGEVESSLRALSGVRDAVVLAREDSPGHRRLVAYVVPSAGASPTAESLREALAPTLPEYMLPAAFVFLEALPVTDTGKVDRRALPAPAQEVGAPDEHFIAPRDALEQQVAEIWRELLGVARVGVRDNFFELGGHSLLAVRLLTRIRERLNRSVPLASLFQDASLEHMVQSLRQGAEREALLVPMSAGRDAPPFFCVHPWEGSVFCYRELAQALEGAVSFLGVQARGVDRVSEPLRRIEDMAALYVAALREAQPEGPYRLGGWSMGGLIAFEMARQLTRAGAEVSLLALIDAPAPATGPGAHDVPDVRTLVEASPVARQWIEGVEDVERALLLHRRHLEAMNDYRADGVRFEGRVLYVQASESPPREADGWKEHCPRLEVRTVNATHHSLVLETDTARLLSEHIRERL